MLDLAVIGAGPCGLAVGVAAKRARLTCSLFDKGPVASSLMRYPLYMTFFSTPDKLEIGVPFVTAGDKPTRREARSEEHTSELQSRLHLVCRLLLEKKKCFRLPRLCRGRQRRTAKRDRPAHRR